MTLQPARHRLSDLVAAALYAAARRSLAEFAAAGVSTETLAEVREGLARDVQHVMEHADPTKPGARLQYGWDWNTGARRERERARSLGIVVHVLHREGTDRFELGRWRLRELCTADGTPVDTVETLRHLAAQLGMGPVPDDVRELAPLDDDPERVTLLRLTVLALTPTSDGHRPCCRRGELPEGLEMTDAHRHAHAHADTIEPERRAEYRAALLAELHRVTGRAA